MSLPRLCGSPAVCVDPRRMEMVARARLDCLLPLNHTKCGRATKSGQTQFGVSAEKTMRKGYVSGWSARKHVSTACVLASGRIDSTS
ncbi:transposase [Stigmatella aurantiaca DW4/3-1]|uniref:Transposase n=1 Tax=Stigmatella aurantiaca (strain DW4/3-1) TaxID=378806 RepID=E3FSX7_STIAD|nr:transposase [Stigmatella aurantiaca DW4/3-1]